MSRLRKTVALEIQLLMKKNYFALTGSISKIIILSQVQQVSRWARANGFRIHDSKIIGFDHENEQNWGKKKRLLWDPSPRICTRE